MKLLFQCRQVTSEGDALLARADLVHELLHTDGRSWTLEKYQKQQWSVYFLCTKMWIIFWCHYFEPLRFRCSFSYELMWNLYSNWHFHSNFIWFLYDIFCIIFSYEISVCLTRCGVNYLCQKYCAIFMWKFHIKISYETHMKFPYVKVHSL